MADIKNVILIGAGGNLGPSVLEAFLASPFNTTVLSRPDSKSTFPSSVKVIKSDYTPASLTDSFKGQDAVVSLVGNAAFSEQTKIIDAAIAAGVKFFIPSEFGSDTDNDKVRAIVPIFEGKKAVVEYLRGKEDKISWAGVITGPFADWGLRVGFLGINLKDKTAQLFDDGDTPITMSTLAQIGRGIVAVLQHTAETKNKYVFVSSLTTTQSKIVAEIESQTGAKYSISHADSKAVSEDSNKRFKTGDHSAVFGMLQGGIFSKEGYGDHRSKLWDEKLGLKEETLEDLVKSVV